MIEKILAPPRKKSWLRHCSCPLTELRTLGPRKRNSAAPPIQKLAKSFGLLRGSNKDLFLSVQRPQQLKGKRELHVIWRKGTVWSFVKPYFNHSTKLIKGEGWVGWYGGRECKQEVSGSSPPAYTKRKNVNIYIYIIIIINKLTHFKKLKDETR